MNEFNLKYTTNSREDFGSYRLLELPPEICKLIESATDDADVGYVPCSSAHYGVSEKLNVDSVS